MADEDLTYEKPKFEPERFTEHESPLPRLKNRVAKNEGYSSHMYRDHQGNITVGIGFWLDRPSKVSQYSWVFKGTSRSAPSAVAQKNWTDLGKAPFGRTYTPKHYGSLPITTVELSRATIIHTFGRKVDKVYQNLIEAFQDPDVPPEERKDKWINFANLPPEVQEAVFDIAWNAGEGKFTENWKKLTAALRDRAWDIAGAESHRETEDVGIDRNAETELLFLEWFQPYLDVWWKR